MTTKISLKVALILGALLVSLVPAVITSAGASRAVQDLVSKQTSDHNLLLARELSTSFQDFLESYRRVVLIGAGQASLLKTLNADSVTPILEKVQGASPYFATMVVTDAKGIGITGLQSAEPGVRTSVGLNLADRGWYKAVAERRESIIENELVIGRTSKIPLVIVASPILDASGRLLGTIAAGISLEAVQKRVAQVNPGKTGRARVATGAGVSLLEEANNADLSQRNVSATPIWPLINRSAEGTIDTYSSDNGEKRLAGYSTVPGVGWKVWVSRAHSELAAEVAEPFDRMRTWAIASVAGGMVLAFIFALLVSGPIENLRKFSERLAQGDLESQAPERGTVEVASLARSFNAMARSMQEMVTRERRSKQDLETAVSSYSDLAARMARGDMSARVSLDQAPELARLGQSLNDMIESLAKLVQQIREAATDVAAAAAEILASTTQQASSTAEEATAVKQTATTVEEVKKIAQLAAQKSREVSEASRVAAETAEEGSRAVNETMGIVREVKSQMEGLAEKIVALSEQAEAISDIITSVNELAEQSNVLAVNAAIESARAGEAGKGFEVVAVEVKALAQQSKQSTAQVRGILRDVQRAIEEAVTETEQAVKTTDAGVAIASRSGDAIRALADSVSGAAKVAIQIEASAQQQSSGMDQTALAMQNIQQASTQNMASTRQMERAAQDLHALAKRLTGIVERADTRAA